GSTPTRAASAGGRGTATAPTVPGQSPWDLPAGSRATGLVLPIARAPRNWQVPPVVRDSAAEALDVGQQCDLTRTLDGRRKLPLVTGAGDRRTRRQDLAALGQEP